MNNKTDTAALLAEVEKQRASLHAVIDKEMDTIVNRILNKEDSGAESSELIYRLSYNPSMFKGTKPLAVIFGGERVSVTKWREAYILILKRCDMEKHSELLKLRNIISGRKRFFISDKPCGMNVPVMLSDDLYIEAYFDTEWLIKVLVKDILGLVGFDYSDISFVLKSPKKGF